MGLTEAEAQALRLSLKVALAAVAISLPAGLATAWVLARWSFRGKTVVQTIVNLPLVLPPVVTGYALLLAFGRSAPLGAALDRWLGIAVVFDWKGAALASAVMAFPLMVRSMRGAFAGVDTRLEQAARTLGAGRARTFLTVTLPLSRAGIAAGLVLAFARSIGEFGATIMIAGSIPGQTRTLPLHLFQLFETPGGGAQAWRAIAVSILIATAAVAVGEALERPRGGTSSAGRPS